MSASLEVQLVVNGEVRHTRTVGSRPLMIGRTQESDVVLSTDAVHRALLWMERDRLWIRDLEGEAGVFIGSRRLEAPAVIDQSVPVRLGRDVELRVRPYSISDGRFPYRMEVDIRGTLGPEAFIEDLTSGDRCTLRSPHRVYLLYLLGQKLHEDAGSVLPVGERGWCSDEVIACGVWGRNWKEQLNSHLYVLLHRIRKQIKTAGLDPQCIEKKRRHARAWVQEAVLVQ